MKGIHAEPKRKKHRHIQLIPKKENVILLLLIAGGSLATQRELILQLFG